MDIHLGSYVHCLIIMSDVRSVIDEELHTWQKKGFLAEEKLLPWSNQVEFEGFLEEEKLLLWSNLVEVEVEWYKNGLLVNLTFKTKWTPLCM